MNRVPALQGLPLVPPETEPRTHRTHRAVLSMLPLPLLLLGIGLFVYSFLGDVYTIRAGVVAVAWLLAAMCVYFTHAKVEGIGLSRAETSLFMLYGALVMSSGGVLVIAIRNTTGLT